MLKQVLVAGAIEEGLELLARLKSARIAVRGAFWLADPDSGDWRLVLAMPVADSAGPLKGYEYVQRALKQMDSNYISLPRVAVFGPRSGRYADLLAAARSNGRLGVPPSGRVKDLVFEDAYIYFA